MQRLILADSGHAHLTVLKHLAARPQDKRTQINGDRPAF